MDDIDLMHTGVTLDDFIGFYEEFLSTLQYPESQRAANVVLLKGAKLSFMAKLQVEALINNFAKEFPSS